MALGFETASERLESIVRLPNPIEVWLLCWGMLYIWSMESALGVGLSGLVRNKASLLRAKLMSPLRAWVCVGWRALYVASCKALGLCVLLCKDECVMLVAILVM